MNSQEIVESVVADQLKPAGRFPVFSVGDTLNVHVRIIEEADLSEAFETMRKAGVAIYAADPQAEEDCFSVHFPPRIAFVLGEESAGLEPEVLKRVDGAIRVPVAGPLGSLNVAVSAAVLLYEACRQRHQAVAG